MSRTGDLRRGRSTVGRATTLPAAFRSSSRRSLSLRSRCCIIDGEAVACGEDGIASFDRIRYRRHNADVFLYAFDLRAVGMTPALSSGLYSSQNGLLLDGEETNEVIVHEKTSVGLTEED
jgi:hypothetical protein